MPGPTTIDPRALVRITDLPISRITLRNAVKSGELEAYAIGRDYFVTQAAVDAWLASRSTVAHPENLRPCYRPGCETRGARKQAPADAAVDRAIASGGLRRVAKRAARRA